ncbi:MAG TPA: hypothetical protein VLY87_05540 [Flavobacterium sp.]|nr:hypothetical protein [Flavobacterium sp.]
MKKLTSEQIDQLFAFTQKHYVEHYDIQVELVDHLANSIEEQWSENPTISFDDALHIEFKKFGVFGFTGLVEQKQAELYKYYKKLIWKQVLQFISIPKVVLTVCLYFVLFSLIKYFQSSSEAILGILVFLSVFYMIFDGFRFSRQMKKNQKNHQKKWLLQSVANRVYSVPTIGFSYSLVKYIFVPSSELPLAYIHFMTVFGLLHFIFGYVLLFKIKPTLKNEIAKTEKKYQFT